MGSLESAGLRAVTIRLRQIKRNPLCVRRKDKIKERRVRNARGGENEVVFYDWLFPHSTNTNAAWLILLIGQSSHSKCEMLLSSYEKIQLGVCIMNTLFFATTGSEESPNIILVDDSKAILSDGVAVLEEVLPSATITGFIRPQEAIDYAKMNRVALAILDIELGTASGLDLSRRLLKINPRTNVVFLTAYPNYALDAWKTDASGFMVKPLTPESVREQLKKLRYPVRRIYRPCSLYLWSTRLLSGNIPHLSLYMAFHSSPSTKIWPDVGFSKRLMQRMSVDFPVPDGPITDTTSPL